ncbi:sigma-70 family RNA polymerase sigma factor [Streptomyces sp. ISL-1]|uniref:sigma-70 family RNA polymerase sigma factor n=1 Tax=Streptomyces sp. ISL-1 TaxID=2817657 RepID=UPI001BE9039A|nr:sigma-70 family RNA polymerase sigma factor [Streptomyces sp. ISL-1]MBT2389818.1 sigma-70 family RNA polymerase sigma factor [Streptomyces sp. ISL-1]
MSGDGRDKSLDGSGGSESAGLSSGQVPRQGGPGGLSGVPGASGPADASGGSGPAAGYDGSGSADGSGTPGPVCGSGASGSGVGGVHEHHEHAVPSQREGGSLDSVLPPPELPMSDTKLIQRMRGGDDSAYEELFRRHSVAVRRYARTCCRDAHTADDLTAEVFARTLQAVRGGSGPEHAVRAYLLTTVRRVAAAWMKTAKREQLVEDFAVFAAEAARSSDVAIDAALDLGADVRAMHEAEQSLAVRAFRSLPERWQAVLWHTTVEEESPSEVAPLFGLTANATAVLASRAREGLRQAYLQAHVSTALTSGGDCARYADRLGAYARGGLRMRAERGLRKHLEECAKCRLAAHELAHVNAGIPALLPVAVIGWFAAGYSLKVAGVVAAGVVAGGAAGAAGAGAGAAAAGGASGSSGGGAGGAAASEGLGAAAKAGIAAASAVAVAAGLVWGFSGDDPKFAPAPEAKPPAAQPDVPQKPAPSPNPESPNPESPATPAPGSTTPSSSSAPSPALVPTPEPTPKPTPARPGPRQPAPPATEPEPTPKPTPTQPAPPPATALRVYQVNRLEYGVLGDHTAPEIRLRGSSWLWQRSGMSIDGTRYGHGVSVHAKSSVTIDLNRQCASYDALVGVDDLTLGLGALRFSVYGDGDRLWRSPVMRGGEAAVPVHVSLAGLKTIRLVVEPQSALGSAALGDWAQARISCR